MTAPNFDTQNHCDTCDRVFDLDPQYLDATTCPRCEAIAGAVEDIADAYAGLGPHEIDPVFVSDLDAEQIESVHRLLEQRDIVLSLSTGRAFVGRDYQEIAEIVQPRPMDSFVNHVANGGDPKTWKDRN